MSQKSKVLLLSTAYLPHVGGSELAIKNITDRIGDLEFHLITAKLGKQLLKEELVSNVLVFRVGGCFGLLKILLPKNLLPLSIFLKARSLIKKNDYKLIHSVQASGAAGAGWLLKLFYPKIPFIITLQEGKDLKSQGFLINFFRKLIIRKADMATAISEYLKNYIVGIKNDLPVKVIPNGVDLKTFSQQFSYGELSDLEKSLNIQPDDKVIISVSRLVPKNGLDLLIEAFHVLNSKLKIENLKLLIIGEGNLEKKLKLQVKSFGLEEVIVFIGLVKNNDLARYLKISDVFVRPSRSEGLGIAFLEAMAGGVPIIGPKIGGIPDFLKDRQTGLFCSLDPEDIARKISILLENSVLRGEIIKKAGQLVEEKYDWDKISEKFRNVYSDLEGVEYPS